MRGLDALRLIGGLIVVLLLLAALTTFLFAALIVGGIVVSIAIVHLVYLPRLSSRLGLSRRTLGLILLPPVAGLGWLIAGEPIGLLWGALFWTATVAMPPLVARYALGRLGARVGWHVQRAPWSPPEARPTLRGVACARCGQYSFDGSSRTCAACGAALPAPGETTSGAD